MILNLTVLTRSYTLNLTRMDPAGPTESGYMTLDPQPKEP